MISPWEHLFNNLYITSSITYKELCGMLNHAAATAVLIPRDTTSYLLSVVTVSLSRTVTEILLQLFSVLNGQ